MKAKYVLCTMIVALACAAQQPAGSPATTPVRISPADAAALLVEKVVPPYPEDEIARHIQNNETLAIQIDEQGNVADAKVLSGHPVFAATSLSSVRQWKYRPYLLNGVPVRVTTTVVIAFRFPNAAAVLEAPKEAAAKSVSNALERPLVDRSEFGKLSIDSKLLDSRLINRFEPQYPQMASVAHIQGDVLLHVLIDKDGHVAKLRAVSGHPLLIQAAKDAVKQWTYKPYEVGGDVIEVESTVKVEFHGTDTAKKQ